MPITVVGYLNAIKRITHMKGGVMSLYEISNQTKVIKLCQNGYYNTEILAINGKVYSSYHPKKILELNCLKFGSSLAGRISLVKKVLSSNSKLPIPVGPDNGIFMFPTTSERNEACIWLSYFQIKQYEEREDMTYVYFIDGTGMYVAISYNQFDSQIKRTSIVIAEFFKMRL